MAKSSRGSKNATKPKVNNNNNNNSNNKIKKKRSKKVSKSKMANVFSVQEQDDDDDKEKFYKKYGKMDSYEFEMASDGEDEDIDEDEAFNSEDELKYGHLNIDGKNNNKNAKMNKKRGQAIPVDDLDGEPEDFEDESDQGEFMDLSEMLGGGIDSVDADIIGSKKNKGKAKFQSFSYSDDENNDDEEVEFSAEEDVDAEGDGVAHSRLMAAFGVEESKNDAQIDREERTEAYEENEFKLNASSG
eukprot:Pgem_evm1s2753